MLTKVFLLGRPGSGKTTAFYHIESMAHGTDRKPLRFREYAILRDMFQAGRPEFEHTKHGGFNIIDFSVLNKSVRQLEKQVQEYVEAHKEGNEIIFLELARDEYKNSMKFFTPEFLYGAYFLFVEADVETCLKRIYHRVFQERTDKHFISEQIIRGYYGQDNKEYMKNNFREDYSIQKEITVIENQGSYEEFIKKLKPFAYKILASEMATI